MTLESGKSNLNLNNSALAISGLYKSYGARLILQNINLAVTAGQSLLLCGVNGVGKSTLLRIIAGLLQPDRGRVQIFGHDTFHEQHKSKPLLGLISHQCMVYKHLTVMENLVFFAELYGIRDICASVEHMLHEADLFEYRREKTGVLSRGMLQRLAIARSLLHQPKILLADEPFTGLDLKSRRFFRNSIEEFLANQGTLLLTTHDIQWGVDCCRRVLVLDGKKMIFDARVEDIAEAEFCRDYLAYIRKQGADNVLA